MQCVVIGKLMKHNPSDHVHIHARTHAHTHTHKHMHTHLHTPVFLQGFGKILISYHPPIWEFEKLGYHNDIILLPQPAGRPQV
jgi:hypothetical protein